MSGLLIALVLIGGCSTAAGGFDGKVVGGCTLHQANSAIAGIAWAACPGNVYITGSSEGYAQAAAPYVSAAALVGSGIAGAFASQSTSTAIAPAPKVSK